MRAGNIQLGLGYQPLSAAPSYTHTAWAFHGPTVGVLCLPDARLFPFQSAHTLSHAEKKGLLKGTPRICLPEGKEQPLAQRWHSLGRCVKPLHPHRLTWGPGESKESQGGRRRHYEEGGPQGHSGRSPWPHTASYTSFGARNPCSKPRGVCCKEIGPGVCYKGLDLEGPLS